MDSRHWPMLAGPETEKLTVNPRVHGKLRSVVLNTLP